MAASRRHSANKPPNDHDGSPWNCRRRTTFQIVGQSGFGIILTYYRVSEDELLGAVDGVNFEAVLDEKTEEKNEKQSTSSQPPAAAAGRR